MLDQYLLLIAEWLEQNDCAQYSINSIADFHCINPEHLHGCETLGLFFQSLTESAHQKTIDQIDNFPLKNADELFDAIITVCENLTPYKKCLQKITTHCSMKHYISMWHPLHKLSAWIFQYYIQTCADHATRTILLTKILHTWIHDNNPDLSTTYAITNKIITNIVK